MWIVRVREGRGARGSVNGWTVGVIEHSGHLDGCKKTNRGSGVTGSLC